MIWLFLGKLACCPWHLIPELLQHYFCSTPALSFHLAMKLFMLHYKFKSGCEYWCSCIIVSSYVPYIVSLKPDILRIIVVVAVYFLPAMKLFSSITSSRVISNNGVAISLYGHIYSFHCFHEVCYT